MCCYACSSTDANIILNGRCIILRWCTRLLNILVNVLVVFFVSFSCLEFINCVCAFVLAYNQIYYIRIDAAAIRTQLLRVSIFYCNILKCTASISVLNMKFEYMMENVCILSYIQRAEIVSKICLQSAEELVPDFF